MAQQSKRSRKYRKEHRGGPKFNIDVNGKRSPKEKIDQKDIGKTDVLPEGLNVDDYEDFE